MIPLTPKPLKPSHTTPKIKYGHLPALARLSDHCHMVGEAVPEMDEKHIKTKDEHKVGSSL